jgi:putative PIG3 family NAD(P)H quinone oxidoreductase
MKAIVVDPPGSSEELSVSDVPEPRLDKHRVLVDVKATALNRVDLLQRRGLYPPPAGESDILGLECAGVVSELGPGVTAVRRGDRVMALLAGGGYAERVSIHERMAMPIPRGMSFEQAAAIPEAFLTATEALFQKARLVTQEVVLINGAAGGVGTAAVQLAHLHGAKVIATASNGDKLAKVEGLGADILINYKQSDVEAALKDRELSVDVILDSVGASYFKEHCRLLAQNGRLIVLGLLGGTKVELDLSTVLRKQHQIIGIVMRTRSLSEKILLTQKFITDTLPLFDEGRLEAVVDSVFPLEEAGRAHQRMENNENIGKIVLSVAN